MTAAQATTYERDGYLVVFLPDHLSPKQFRRAIKAWGREAASRGLVCLVRLPGRRAADA